MSKRELLVFSDNLIIFINVNMNLDKILTW